MADSKCLPTIYKAIKVLYNCDIHLNKGLMFCNDYILLSLKHIDLNRGSQSGL